MIQKTVHDRHTKGCYLVRASEHHLRAFGSLFSMRFIINNHATRARLELAAALVFLSITFYYLGPDDFRSHSVTDEIMELVNEKRSNCSTWNIKEMDCYLTEILFPRESGRLKAGKVGRRTTKLVTY